MEVTSGGQRAANAPPTGGPGISGTPQVGETLTATTTGIADEDGLTGAVFAYQWIRHDLDTQTDTNIDNANGETYTVTAEDEGKALKVRVTFTDDAGNEQSLTSNAYAVSTPLVIPDEDEGQQRGDNAPAAGEPGIDGTPLVDQTLTATTTGIADEDGLTDLTFAYQWIRHDPADATDEDIEEATGETYTVTAGDAGQALRVRVTFTDDAGNEESLTSAATAAVKPPLTAAIHGAPASHDGESAFTFELRFSEEFSISYETLRDHAFTVTEGEVTRARQMEPPGNVRWEISVEPSSGAGVTVSLPATTDCEAQGAVCTADGRMLSSPLEFTVGGPAAQQQAANSPATGALAISGTARVGEPLAASTSGIADEDGLTNPAFSYQWIRKDGATDTDIAGATESSYTLSDADEGKTIRVRVSFTDDANNEESLTSAATAAVAPRPPLTAGFGDKPPAHDGHNAFTFQLHFSEELGISYLTLRDHAFSVTNGTVTTAKRLMKGNNLGWTITIQPDSGADVTVALPVTTDCNAAGAICTGDGRKLSNRNAFIVSGPGQ